MEILANIERECYHRIRRYFPEELVFTLPQSLFLFLKKDFLNSPTKIFFKMAAKLAKTTAILREDPKSGVTTSFPV